MKHLHGEVLESLSGTTIRRMNQSIDYQKIHLKDRVEVIEGLLSQNDFYEEYFSNYFKPNITSKDPLSEDINVCRSLTRMADYILNSKDIKQEKELKKAKHTYYTDDQYFYRKLEKEINFSDLVDTTSSNNEEDFVHLLKCSAHNHKKEKIQEITSEDLKRTDFLGQVLNNYKEFNDYLGSELKSKTHKSNRYLLSKMKGQTAWDMLYCKDSLSGVFAYKVTNISESNKPNYNTFDFTDKDHLLGKLIPVEGDKPMIKVKGLLYFKPRPLINGDFALVLHDLSETIKKAKLSNREEFVLHNIQDGIPNTSIAKRLNISRMDVTRIMQRIAKKVIAVGNQYDKHNDSICK